MEKDLKTANDPIRVFEDFQQKFPDFQGTYQELAQKVYKWVKKVVDDRQKEQLKILKRLNKELQTPNKSIRRLIHETNLSFGRVQLILKKDLHFFPIVFCWLFTFWNVNSVNF
jgi:hypothetical protein